MPQDDFPVREIPISTGDRYLLYTDGMIEPENLKGEAFGDQRFEEIVRASHWRPCGELSDRLSAELHAWQTPSAQQPDDITLIVVDVI